MKSLDELDSILLGGHGRRNRTEDIIGRLQRIVRKAPEVVIKVSGASKGSHHLKSHLEYVTRDGVLHGENERGETVSGLDDVHHLHHIWMSDGGRRKPNTRDSINLVLSMPALTDPDAVLDAARAFARKNFGHNHQYMFVLHTDEDHPHVHLTVKALGFDGVRLNPRKADLRRWREAFAQAMREQGIEAEATPRFARGTTKKAKQFSVLKQEERFKAGRTKERPKVEVEKVRQVATELVTGKPDAEPWKDVIETNHRKVVGVFQAVAQELKQSGIAEHRALAQEVEAFVKNFPSIKTRRDEIRETMQALKDKTKMEKER